VYLEIQTKPRGFELGLLSTFDHCRFSVAFSLEQIRKENMFQMLKDINLLLLLHGALPDTGSVTNSFPLVWS